MKSFVTYVRWTFLVGLNTILSLLFAVGMVITWQEGLALIFAILTFVIAYASVDILLLKKEYGILRSSLQTGVIISAVFYLLIPFIPIGTGTAAIELVNGTLKGIDPTSHHKRFVTIYFIVLVDGLLLSTLAMLPVLIVYSISILFKKNQSVVKI